MKQALMLWSVFALGLGLGSLGILSAQAQGSPPASPATELSASEQAQLQTLSLTQQLAKAIEGEDQCRAQLGPLRTQVNQAALQQQMQTVKAAIEANPAHAGYTFTFDKGFVPRSTTSGTKPEVP